MSDPDRFKFHGDEHYLKSVARDAAPVRRGPRGVRQHALDRRAGRRRDRVRQAAAAELPAARGLRRPTPTTCATSPSRAPASAGATSLPDAIVERLAYELQVIDNMGFSSYFLIVWDLIQHARDNDIRVGPGRGSAAGCAVAYSLWITDLDPIRTTCCSSASSTRAASRCPTSTWTSTPATGTR